MYFALVLEWLEKTEVEMEIPEMDLYILRDSNVGIDAWFDAGSGAAGWNPVPCNKTPQHENRKLSEIHE